MLKFPALWHIPHNDALKKSGLSKAESVLATKEDEKNCKQKNITTDDDNRTWIAGMTSWNCTIKFCGHPWQCEGWARGRAYHGMAG
jgi:hypothetical protein